jgi:hypothetical protein
MVLVTESGVVLLDQGLRRISRHDAAFTGPVNLVLNGETVLIAEAGWVTMYNRAGLAPVRVWDTQPVRDIAMGKGRLFVVTEEGFTFHNIYAQDNESPLWEARGSYTAYAFYRGAVYAASPAGTVSAFCGEPNTSAPETVIILDPPEPGGLNGWYVTAPELGITVRDRESYVREVRSRIDGTEFNAAETLRITDGEHQITVSGVDSYGLVNTTARQTVKVDTTPPETDIVLSEEMPASGWYGGPVTITLEGWDLASGFERLETSLGRYIDPIVIGGEGATEFFWYAVDRAGNHQKKQYVTINIDRQPPYAEAALASDRGIGEITLYARDAVSGVQLIEYRVNGSGIMPYREPVYLNEGSYRVQYRALDYAGNYSAWQECEALIDPVWPRPVLIEAAGINGMNRYAAINARNGLPVLRAADDYAAPEPDRSRPEALINLPSYVLGAEYVLWEETDRTNTAGLIRVRVARDAVVYLFLTDGEEAPPAWTLVETGLSINHAYYPGIRRVYMRRLPAGSVVELLCGAGMLPPFIALQETGTITADIKISREDETDPRGFYGIYGTPGADGEFRAGDALRLDHTPSPWRYTRRLPLLRRWFVFTNAAGDAAGDATGDDGSAGEDSPADSEGGWEVLEGNRCTIPEDHSGGFLRFRLEITTPDGQVEYRGEKAVWVTAALQEEVK